MTLEDLENKIATADGPNFALEGQIMMLADPEMASIARVRASMPSGAPAHVVERDAPNFAPNYTASIDKAVDLIARVTGASGTVARRITGGWSWRTGNLPSGRGFAILGVSPTEHVAATPALALCLALIRTLRAEQSP